MIGQCQKSYARKTGEATTLANGVRVRRLGTDSGSNQGSALAVNPECPLRVWRVASHFWKAAFGWNFSRRRARRARAGRDRP